MIWIFILYKGDEELNYGFLIKSILLQVVLFCSVPLIYWSLKRRKEISFFRYVGLIQAKKTGKLVEIAVFAWSYILVYGIVHFIPVISALTQPSANAYEGVGAAAIIPAIFVCFIQQALSEEVLFRGFIGKRLNSKMGFNYGNAIQASIFSLIHVLLSVSNDKDIVSYLIIFVSITAGGWFLGYLNEKLCGGSIIPSILLHGLGNYIMILTVAF